MPVPKRRTAKASRNQRRSHHFRVRMGLATCAKCGSPVPAHVACPVCGTYKGREIMDVMKKMNKDQRKKKEKARQQ
jgi:large subunit ribosomal protein L32